MEPMEPPLDPPLPSCRTLPLSYIQLQPDNYPAPYTLLLVCTGGSTLVVSSLFCFEEIITYLHFPMLILKNLDCDQV